MAAISARVRPCFDEAWTLPDAIAALKAMALASRAERRNRDLLIEKLKHQLAGLRRQRFGVTSEALDQLEFEIGDEEIARAAEAPPEPAPSAKRQPKRRPLPDHLPREEMVLAPGERCAGRTTLERRGLGGGLVPLLGRPQGRASEGPS